MRDEVLELTIVVPSYNPDGKLSKVVDGLREKGFRDIIVVNDGSDDEHMDSFAKVEGRCTVIHHKENKGKGRAMKTAFAFCMEHRKQSKGVITVDGDNQHHPDDVYACGKALLNNRGSLVLGCRDFHSNDVPFKSKYGNGITKNVFRFLCGLRISDTQTGLRAMGMNLLPDLMKIKGERYEYETNMLLETKRLNLPITEVPIRTIYINDNESSHFNPFKDSMKIYGMIIKFFMNSMASTVIDLGIFFVLCTLLGQIERLQTASIFIATMVARICSSLFNYRMNRTVVFGQGSSHSIIKYYILCISQMTVSASLVALVSAHFTTNSLLSTCSKALIDTGLFFISYQIQKNWVFRKKEEKGSSGVITFQPKLSVNQEKQVL